MGWFAYPYVPDLPYAIFMRHAIMEITEQSLYQMREHWQIETPICESELEGKPLSFKKLISMFLLFSFGVILALITLLCELKTENQENQKKFEALEKTMIIENGEEVKNLPRIMEDMEKLLKSCRSLNVTLRIIIKSKSNKHQI